MFIYGTKAIFLKTIDLPLPCSSCGRTSQKLNIYRNFFSLFFITIFPFRKHAIICCPSCCKQQAVKNFFNELASEGKDVTQTKVLFKALMKEAKVPLSTYAITCIASLFIIGFHAFDYHEERQHSIQAASYAQNPIENVLVVTKENDDNYPYHILYIPKIKDQDAVVFEWKYIYESINDAKREMHKVINSITNNTVQKNFFEPLLVSLEEFSSVDFVYVNSLDTTVDWEKFIQ